MDGIVVEVELLNVKFNERLVRDETHKPSDYIQTGS